MAKHVLDVGQCDPDHGSITRLLTKHFDVEIDRAHVFADAKTALSRQRYDLVLINRLLDRDQAEGMLLLEFIKDSTEHADTPVMIISNFPETQAAAVEAGAVPGFGKAALGAPETVDSLRPFLDD